MVPVLHGSCFPVLTIPVSDFNGSDSVSNPVLIPVSWFSGCWLRRMGWNQETKTILKP